MPFHEVIFIESLLVYVFNVCFGALLYILTSLYIWFFWISDWMSESSLDRFNLEQKLRFWVFLANSFKRTEVICSSAWFNNGCSWPCRLFRYVFSFFFFAAPILSLSSHSVQPPTRWRFISGSGVFQYDSNIQDSLMQPNVMKIIWFCLFIYLLHGTLFWIRMCTWFLTHPCIYSTGTVTEKDVIIAVCDFHYISLWTFLMKARKCSALVILKLSSSEGNHTFGHCRRTDKSTGMAGWLF